MDFKIDFGNVGAPPVAVDQPLYASEDGIASSLGGDECVFEVRRTGVVHPMTTQVLQALDMCRPFLSLKILSEKQELLHSLTRQNRLQPVAPPGGRS